MKLHRTVLWSLRADTVRRSLEHCKPISANSFRWHWSAGPSGSYGVVFVRTGVSSLVEDIELWLRERIEGELKRAHGNSWWSAIPRDIRQRAEHRHRLACAEFGSRRAGAPHSATWLSFGDTLRILDGLSQEAWVHCLGATVQYERQFSRALRRIKAFRDARIAHLQSGGPTATDVSKVLVYIDKLCELLRPQDYLLSMAARKVLFSQQVSRHRALLFDLYETSSKPRPQRAARLRALERILPPSPDGVPRGLDLMYYDALLGCCAEAGGTISGFVGDA